MEMPMKTRVSLLVATMLLCSSHVLADDLHGHVHVKGAGAAIEAVVHLVDRDSKEEVGAFRTNPYGDFRGSVAAKKQGYAVYVSYQGKDSSRVLVPVSGETRADLELESGPNGWQLTKR